MVSLTRKMVPVLVRPKTIVTNAFIAAVAGLIKRDALVTLQNFAYRIGILSGSAHNILTQ